MSIDDLRAKRYLPAILAGLLLLAAGAGAAEQPDGGDDVVLRAMRDELERTMKELRLEDLSRPYFVAYRVDEKEELSVAASFGSPLEREHGRRRWLEVEVRVGDRMLDNTNFLSFPSFGGASFGGFGGIAELPLDDDYRELRRQIWLATDSAYKSALEDLAKKKAALENKTRTEELADFSQEEPAEVRDEHPRPAFDDEAVSALVTELSAVFRRLEAVYASQVSCRVAVVRTRYVNSEGTTYERVAPLTHLLAWASTQAADGMRLEDFESFYGRSPADLPPADVLTARVTALGKRLDELRSAQLIERYNGPVLFAGQAAAELFAQVFAPKLLARRQPVTSDQRLASLVQGGGEGGDFTDRVGARVLPRFLSVTDDPTAGEIDGMPLLGGYKVDDQGVLARPTPVIERGYLKRLLTSRTPVTGIDKSSGHFRGGGVAPSNLIVRAAQGLSPEELKQELLSLVADRGGEYGVIVTRLDNPRMHPQLSRSLVGFSVQDGGAPLPIVAYQVFPDGRETLLRNVEISGLSAASFKDVVAAAARAEPYAVPFSPQRDDPFRGFLGAVSGEPVVSLVVPSLLFEELTLKKPSGEIPKPPVAKHPYFDRRGE